MSFKLSRRSLDRLEGIDDGLQAVVKMAITLTKTDFGVVQGMRTVEQQKNWLPKARARPCGLSTLRVRLLISWRT